MEVETDLVGNPIVQDQKKDKKTGEKYLRHYGLNPMFNYGMIPQTWENARHTDAETGLFGDNDPIDIVDMTNRDMSMFEIPHMKVLGALCMIDEGELDWKILAVEESFAKLHGIRDVESFSQHHPGAVKDIIHWFRIYKTLDGKPENSFGYNDQVLSVEKTI